MTRLTGSSQALIDELQIRGPFVVIDTILYLRFDRNISIDTHRRTFKAAKSSGRHLDHSKFLMSYLLDKNSGTPPLNTSITYERAVELLVQPAVLGCLPDPASTQLFLDFGVAGKSQLSARNH